MKVLIDITDDEYKGIVQNNPKNFIPIDYCEVIRNGTPLNGTNGEVFKKVFEDCVTSTGLSVSIIGYLNNEREGVGRFGTTWWNAPYKTESEEV